MKTIKELMIIKARAESDASVQEAVEFMEDDTWFKELEARLAEGYIGEPTALHRDIIALR